MPTREDSTSGIPVTQEVLPADVEARPVRSTISPGVAELFELRARVVALNMGVERAALRAESSRPSIEVPPPSLADGLGVAAAYLMREAAPEYANDPALSLLRKAFLDYLPFWEKMIDSSNPEEQAVGIAIIEWLHGGIRQRTVPK